MQEGPPLSDGERAELERLRAEVASLRSQLGQAEAARPARGGRGGRWWWRTTVATVLIVVACLLAPLSVVAVWARNQVSNTDRYVATVAPLARNPDIQNAIADQITAQVFTYLDVQQLTAQAVDALAGRGLPRGWPTSSARSPARSPTGSAASPAPRSARWCRARRSPTPGSRPTGPPTTSWSRR